jgi:hypothetical protein
MAVSNNLGVLVPCFGIIVEQASIGAPSGIPLTSGRRQRTTIEIKKKSFHKNWEHILESISQRLFVKWCHLLLVGKKKNLFDNRSLFLQMQNSDS